MKEEKIMREKYIATHYLPMDYHGEYINTCVYKGLDGKWHTIDSFLHTFAFRNNNQHIELRVGDRGEMRDEEGEMICYMEDVNYVLTTTVKMSENEIEPYISRFTHKVTVTPIAD